MVLSRLILGLLALAPMSGYDVKKHVDSTIRHFWAADKAQVYRALASLVREGLATVEVIPQEGRPDRQEHRITEAGRRALRDWLASPLPTPTDRDPFLARVFFAGDLEPEEVRVLLAQRREQTQELLAALTALRPATAVTDRAGYLRVATLENGLAHARAELDWLDTLEKDLP
ncbi:PadR family transcriptional regulator [Georgenia thermotolerans]|uniref:PadR family transcriptional regulator n=1 Tax=Georgenia thermotolerans TaxID=527326 RepID=A0A7J5UV39_9MICO|nr:PadR family transcriptional regulator [Georgenia thermotolerans]KAE8766155.1 PadR family transcriptional regulator [Georgenia thermotolerans]